MAEEANFCAFHSKRANGVGGGGGSAPSAGPCYLYGVPSPLPVWLKFMGIKILQNESFVLGKFLEAGGIGYFRNFYRWQSEYMVTRHWEHS